jgi:spoIIIJ-associated protein
VSDDLRVETTGETVGEAKWQALRELERLDPGVDKSSVRFQVVSEGERGLLGVGYSPARVVATVEATSPPPPAHDESARAARVRELIDRFAGTLGFQCHVEIREDEESIVASCSGRDLGMLIGKHGQTIDALQYLANAIAHRDTDQYKPIVIDAAGYRARRQATLDALAVRSAERALQSGRPVELDPMTAVERKVVHLRLKDFRGVETTSEGTEPNRFVVVRPAAEPGGAEAPSARA